MTKSEINLIDRVAAEAEFGNPLTLDTSDFQTAKPLIARGYLADEGDNQVELTEAGYAAWCAA